MAAGQHQARLQLLEQGRRVAVLAAVLLTLLPEVLRPIAEYRMILYSFMLIVLMILRPQGLFNFKFGKTRF